MSLFVSVVLVIIAFVLLASLGGALIRAERHRRDAASVDRFNAARALTTRWATDPSSIPEPVRRLIDERERTATDEAHDNGSWQDAHTP